MPYSNSHDSPPPSSVMLEICKCSFVMHRVVVLEIVGTQSHTAGVVDQSLEKVEGVSAALRSETTYESERESKKRR